MAGRLILMCGLAGSGKTTVAKRLASERPAVRLSPDEWMIQLGIDAFDAPARERVEHLQWTLAQALTSLGQMVILEAGFWQRYERDVARLWARDNGVAIELHHLDVPIDELTRRLEARNRDLPPGSFRIDPHLNVLWVDRIQHPDADELALFDPPPT